MKFNESPITGVFVVTAQPHLDDRGWFARMFCKNEFREIGIDAEFVQLNQSFNHVTGTFRGMHYQAPPYAEKKLIRCVAGAILDFVIDLRKGSPTFLNSYAIELSAENKTMLLIPEGIAHGFITLEDKTSLLYHHTAVHHPASERGLRFNDPRVKLELPRPITVISDRDKGYPLLENDFVGIVV
jgi:dTDP-4-dehydrorhamnose 3,5-epimerase